MANFDINTLMNSSFGGTPWNVPAQINRTSAGVLDMTTIFYSLDAAKRYANGESVEVAAPNGKKYTYNGATAYPGQVIAVVTSTSTDAYVIRHDRKLTRFKDADSVLSGLTVVTANGTQTDLNIVNNKLQLSVEGGLEYTNGVLKTKAIDIVTNISAATDTEKVNPPSTAAVITYGAAMYDAKGAAATAVNELANDLPVRYLSAGVANSPTATDKLTKASEVKAMIDALDVAKLTLNPNETLSTIEEVDGKVIVTKQTIDVGLKDYTPLQTFNTLSTKVDSVKTELDNAEATIQTVSADYLKAADKTELTGLINQKLATETFNAFKNDTGLSAANATNKVATQNDIKSLTNVMHFIGVTTTALSTGSTVTNLEGITFADSTGPVPGDIVLAANSKEFIWSNGQWHEIGQEGVFATSAELEAETKARADADTNLQAQITAISNDYLKAADKTELNGKIEAETTARTNADTNLQAQITAISNDYLKAADKTELKGKIEAETSARTTAISTLSTAIDQKVLVDGEKADTLNVRHVSQEQFHDLVADGELLSTELYVVSSDTLNMYNERITNLGAPEEATDAATKEYVDNLSAEVTPQIQSLATALSSIHASDLIWDIQISCGNANN